MTKKQVINKLVLRGIYEGASVKCALNSLDISGVGWTWKDLKTDDDIFKNWWYLDLSVAIFIYRRTKSFGKDIYATPLKR